ncbi:MAG: HNH endonuclease [Pseudomonadota bacterium]|nr:HNH endonuclease [Pseudomonadota bacterium]
MEGDAVFAQGMEGLGVNLNRTPRGLAPRTSPGDWVWHHAQEPGVMQLVPRSQQAPGSIFQNVLHPSGRGGYSIWGKK